MTYGPHGPWRHLALGSRFYLRLLLGAAGVVAACAALVLWRRPDVMPLFLSSYLPIGLTVLGIALGLTILAIWIEKRFE